MKKEILDVLWYMSGKGHLLSVNELIELTKLIHFTGSDDKLYKNNVLFGYSPQLPNHWVAAIIGVTEHNGTLVNMYNYHPGRHHFQNTYDLEINGCADHVYAQVKKRLTDSLVSLSRLHNS